MTDADDLRRQELEKILASSEEAEKLRLRVEAVLELEKIKLEREKNERDQERLEREKRRWWANPIFVAVAAGALSLAGDAIVSGKQGARDLALQEEAARDDLILKAFSEDVDQTIANLEFLIAAQLLQDPDGTIISAAQEFGPRASVTTSATPERPTPRLLDQPVIVTARLERVIDGDSFRIRSEDLVSQLQSTGGVRTNSDGSITIRLAGVDAAETRGIGCEAAQVERVNAWGKTASDKAKEFLAFEPSQLSLVTVAVLAVDGFGRATSVISRDRADSIGLDQVFERSLNVALIQEGLATPVVVGDLPGPLTQLLISEAARAESSKQGMWADMTDTFDLTAESLGVVPPWLVRRACFAVRTEQPFEEYMSNHLETNEVRDAGTRKRLSSDDLFDVGGSTIRMTRRMRDLVFPPSF